ncbi:hypothetical protein [Sphingobium sp. LSP13-1-1.1]|uniref:hypothetical protein n=1 Tax=Sphingobium sp. LSP13-1-1.1 TaxID=3135234 RepID=UPI00342E29D4
MAMKNLLGTGVFNWKGNSIKIRSELGALDALFQATGKDPLTLLQTATSQMEMAELFFHLQYDTAYTREEIYAGLFARLDDFLSEEFQMKLAKCLADCIGTELVEKLEPAEDTQKK